MSIDEPPAILLRRCKERSGIRLTRDYLQSWKDQRTSPINDIAMAYTEIVADFLKTDISVSSEPVIPENHGQLPVDTFPPGHLRQGGGVVLQIQDTNDISHSALSQLDNLNTGQEWPRGKLRWILSDGTRQVQATEFQTITSLNLKTPFGSKVLIKSCQVRRGMLMLTAENVTLLGGGVPEIYGGNMIKELQTRLKARLNIAVQPNTPTPASRPLDTSSTVANTSNNGMSTSTSDNASYNIMSTNVNTRLAAELDDLNDMDMNQFDDIDMDDEFGYDDDMDEDSMNTPTISHNIPPAPTNDDSDDDFVTTQVSPVRSRLVHKAPVSLSKKVKVNPPEDIIPIKKEKTPVVETVHWIDPSTWLDDEEDKIEGVEVRQDGKTYVTFDALHRIIGQMEKNTFTGSLADTVIVQVKYMKMAAMRLSDFAGFYSIFIVGDPLGKNKGTIKVVIGNTVSYTSILL